MSGPFYDVAQDGSTITAARLTSRAMTRVGHTYEGRLGAPRRVIALYEDTGGCIRVAWVNVRHGDEEHAQLLEAFEEWRGLP